MWRGMDVRMLSGRAAAPAAGRVKEINYVETLSGVFLFDRKTPGPARRGARLRCRGRRNYAINPEIIPPTRSYGGRSRTADAAACSFSNAAIGPAKLGALLSTEHEVEIRFFPRGGLRFVARAYLAIKP